MSHNYPPGQGTTAQKKTDIPFWLEESKVSTGLYQKTRFQTPTTPGGSLRAAWNSGPWLGPASASSSRASQHPCPQAASMVGLPARRWEPRPQACPRLTGCSQRSQLPGPSVAPVTPGPQHSLLPACSSSPRKLSRTQVAPITPFGVLRAHQVSGGLRWKQTQAHGRPLPLSRRQAPSRASL